MVYIHRAPTDIAFDRRAIGRPIMAPEELNTEVLRVRVLPGEHYVTCEPDMMIVTLLGSCVAACVRDPFAGVGGMNHFMLPQSVNGSWGAATASLRYGNFAMEKLINDVLGMGGRRDRLEIKVFGGGNVLRNGGTIGWQNAEFVEAYLKAEGLPIAARHLYGDYPRRVHYHPATGKASMLELRRDLDLVAVEPETIYGEALKNEPLDGSIELFE